MGRWAWLLLWCCALGAEGATGPTPEPEEKRGALPPVVIDVPEAAGPPDLTCQEALGAAPPAPPRPAAAARPIRRRPAPAAPRPDPDAMAQVPGDAAVSPAELAPQPLEGTPQTLAAIGAVMKGARDGERSRISFFGASHVEGEYWTGHLRRLLQDRHGDIGHGFVLPARLFRGHRAQDVNLCSTDGWTADWAGRRDGHGDGLLGFAGMSVASAHPGDFGWVETTRENPHGRAVSFFDVFTLGAPAGGTLNLVVDEAEPRKISTQAPEPTLLRHRVVVPEGAHRLMVEPAGDGEVRIFGVSMEREGPGILVDSMGIRGRQARSWLQWNEELATPGLRALAPDLVVLAYGTNEANEAGYELDAYARDLDEVMGRLRRDLPYVPCVLVGPSDRFVKLGEDRFAIWEPTADFAGVQRDRALAHDCAFWDWQQATGGPGSMVSWFLHEPSLASPDGIHFTRAGYELSAERFLAALDALTPGL